MVTPVSVAGATARALAPLIVDVAVETAEGLLVLTDFPDCFSIVLDFTVCFDAAAGFFVAGAGFAGLAGFAALGEAGFDDADFDAGFDDAGLDVDFSAGFAATFEDGFAGLAAFFFAAAGRFDLTAGFGAGSRALLATPFARGADFAFFAPAAAGFFVAIACVHLVSAAACYSPSPTLRQPPKSPRRRAPARARGRGNFGVLVARLSGDGCILIGPPARSPEFRVAHRHPDVERLQALAESALRIALPVPSELLGLRARRDRALRRAARRLARHPAYPALSAAVRRRDRSRAGTLCVVAAPNERRIPER
jgi:hypothetical protein